LAVTFSFVFIFHFHFISFNQYTVISGMVRALFGSQPSTKMLRSRTFLLLASASLCSAQYGPDPPGVSSDFLCKWRKTVLNYSTKLRPDAKQLVYDALAIDQYCNGTMNRPTGVETPSIFPPSKLIMSDDARTLYVDGTHGADSNPGTLDKPFKSIQSAIEASRGLPGGGNKTVVVKSGTYYLTSALQLTPADSHLKIQNQGGDEVWLSGGTLLGNLNWSEYKVSKGSMGEVQNATNNAYGCNPDDPEDPVCGCSVTEDLNSCLVGENISYYSLRACIPFHSSCILFLLLLFLSPNITPQQSCHNDDSCTAFTWHDSMVTGS
jgi:hypothetical protein